MVGLGVGSGLGLWSGLELVLGLESASGTGPYKPRTSTVAALSALASGHTPSEKGAVSVNVLTIDQLVQLRNSLFS